jgi:hypothetical protein
MISAVPGLAVAYLVLTGLLLGRVRPLPITFVPQPASDLRGDVRHRVAA